MTKRRVLSPGVLKMMSQWFVYDDLCHYDTVQLLQTQIYRWPGRGATESSCNWNYSLWCQDLLVKVALKTRPFQSKSCSLLLFSGISRKVIVSKAACFFSPHPTPSGNEFSTAFVRPESLPSSKLQHHCRMKQIEELNCSFSVCQIKAQDVQK